MNTNSKTQSLQEQIMTVLGKSEWVTPQNNEGTVLGTLSDHGKACFTLMKQKDELLTEKKTQLKTLRGENSVASRMGFPFDMLEELGGSIFNLGGGLGISIKANAVDITEVVRVDSSARAALVSEIEVLTGELKVLKSMVTLEIILCIPAEAYTNSHGISLNENFEVVGCKHALEGGEDKALFEECLKKLLENFDVILIAPDHELLGNYDTLMKELADESVVCRSGFIPDLSNANAKAIFLPKELDKAYGYEDVHIGGTNAAGKRANERQGRVQELFDQIRQAGEAYVPQAKEETAEA